MKGVIAALRQAQVRNRVRCGGSYWVYSGAWLSVKNWEVIHNYVASWKYTPKTYVFRNGMTLTVKGDPRWN